MKLRLFDEVVSRYVSGLIVYGIGYLIYTKSSFYVGFTSADTKLALKSLLMIYLFAGIPFQALTLSQKHKPSILLASIPVYIHSLKRFCYSFLKLNEVSDLKLTKLQIVTLQFFLVKLFYIPLMLNFFFDNARGVWQIYLRKIVGGEAFDFRTGYTDIFTVVFAIDTLIFAFGYLIEHKRLGNLVRSVEPTILGWAVALASYPPFNSVSAQFFNWYSQDYFYFQNIFLDLSLKSLVVFGLLLYLWASISLGFKASNLTNRGTVTGGAYKYIRHPAYAGKLLVWWITALKNLSLPMMISMSCWTALYFMRAITEERHLIKDREYKAYVKMTKYRFIPGLI